MLIVLDAIQYVPSYITEMGKKDMYVTMAMRDLMGYCCDLVFGHQSEYDMEGSRSFLIGVGVRPDVLARVMEVVYEAIYQIFMSIPSNIRNTGQYRASTDINMVITVTGGNGYVPRM